MLTPVTPLQITNHQLNTRIDQDQNRTELKTTKSFAEIQQGITTNNNKTSTNILIFSLLLGKIMSTNENKLRTKRIQIF